MEKGVQIYLSGKERDMIFSALLRLSNECSLDKDSLDKVLKKIMGKRK